MIVSSSLYLLLIDLNDPKEFIANDPRLKQRTRDFIINNYSDFLERFTKLIGKKNQSFKLWNAKGELYSDIFNHWFFKDKYLLNIGYRMDILFLFYLFFMTYRYNLKAVYLTIKDGQYINLEKHYEITTEQNTENIKSINPLKRAIDNPKTFVHSSESIIEEDNLRAMAQIHIRNFIKFKDQIFYTIIDDIF